MGHTLFVAASLIGCASLASRWPDKLAVTDLALPK